MYNKETFLTRLRNGETTQSIADEFAKLINEANKEYQAELAAKKASAQKRKEAEDILNLTKSWALKYCTKTPKEKEMLEQLFAKFGADEFANVVEDINRAFFDAPLLLKLTTETNNELDELDKWLKKMGW